MRKIIVLLTTLLAACAQSYNGLPVVTRNANTYAYVGFNNKLYTFSLPSLNLAKTFTADSSVTFYDPASASGSVVTLSDEASPGVYTVNVDTNTFAYNPAAPQPQAQYPSPTDFNLSQTDAQGNVYNYTLNGAQSFVSKYSPSGAVQILQLPKTYNNHGIFSLQNGVLYLTATTFVQRGSSDYDYYAIGTSSFSIIDGPVTLPNTATAGCPVPPRNCGVNVLKSLSIVDGLIVYVFTNAGSGQGPFQVRINTYQKNCGISTNSFTDISSPSTTGTGSCSNSGGSTGNSGSSTGNSGSSTTPGSVPTGDNSDPESTCTPNGCAGGAKCCAGQCYSTGQYTCYTRSDGSKQLCPAGLSICGSACYNSSQYSCANNQLL